MKKGDIVEYIDDWIKGRQWYLADLYGNGLCKIILIRNGDYKSEKNGEIRLNSNIVNLNIEKIRKN